MIICFVRYAGRGGKMTDKETMIITMLEREAKKAKLSRDAKYRQGRLSAINWLEQNLGSMLNYDWTLCEEGLPRQGEVAICLCECMLGLGQEIFTYQGDNTWKGTRHSYSTITPKAIVEKEIIAWRHFGGDENNDNI